MDLVELGLSAALQFELSFAHTLYFQHPSGQVLPYDGPRDGVWRGRQGL